VHQTTFGREDEIEAPLLRDAGDGGLQLRQEILLQLLRQALDVLLGVLGLTLQLALLTLDVGLQGGAGRVVAQRPFAVELLLCRLQRLLLVGQLFLPLFAKRVDPRRGVLAFGGLRRDGLDVDPPELGTLPERDGSGGRRWRRQRRGGRRIRLFRRGWRLSLWTRRRRTSPDTWCWVSDTNAWSACISGECHSPS